MAAKHERSTIGNRIRQRRMQQGMSQTLLAGSAGIDRTLLSKMELGHVQHPKYLDAIATALECSEPWLRYGYDQPIVDAGAQAPDSQILSLHHKVDALQAKQGELHAQTEELHAKIDEIRMMLKGLHLAQ